MQAPGDNAQIKCAQLLKDLISLLTIILTIVNEGSELNREINLLSQVINSVV